ncbi:MAG TPA: branched-chain amino acid ABC transporter permease, partial [Rhodopila sp.]|nr:branched-chain amino acid ABC transporter permease [Rhodopila sp.]
MLTGAIVAGIVFGLYYTLVGLGLNLVFGVMRIVNLAHGDFLMLGGVAAWALFTTLGLHPLVAAILVVVAFVLLGLPIYYLVVPRLLRSRDSEMLSLILFFGLSQMIEAITTISIGATERSLPPRILGVGPVLILGTRLPKAWIYSAAVSAVA